MAEPIYPVVVKSGSDITDWSGWPDDVRPTLEAWNHKGGAHSLSFREWWTFKCPDCERFCRQHNGAILDGVPICDDCLILRAEAVVARG